MIKRAARFLTNMDAKAWRTVVITFLLTGGIGFIFFFGMAALGFEGEALVEQWLGFAAHSPYSLLIAVGAFAVLAFLGVPQVVLIAAAVVAFGPWLGFAYSWVGTMVSSLIGFGLGRAFGARLLREFGGDGIQRFMHLVARNGFLASLVVRLVPAAPFVAINMAGGVTPMRLRAFAGGTAIGIIPKIVLIIVAGNSVVQAKHGSLWINALILIAVLLIWVGAGLVARRWIKTNEAAAEAAGA
ncbi:MAG: TVP38/TMEM64 family protein [Caulobacteraceae bacterium]